MITVPSQLDAPRVPPVTQMLNHDTESASRRWYRPALGALLVVTAALYVWDLGASGWGNAFYSAAVQAGSKSWKAFFFGSFDASNAITVDKPPASLWLMEISARLFGVNAWSILVPQALLGVTSVALVAATVRRRFGDAAALIAGAVLALTPVAVLMFRFNNPDAMLVTLLVAGTYAMTRALEKASTRWILLAGSLIGFAFLAKMLQAFLVVPAFALAYLVAAPTPLRRRLWQVLAAGGALIASAGWWVAIVSLVPASSRPYIGGSQGNSVLELVWGYNGLGRITGNETGSVTAGGAGAGNQWGTPGWSRLFGASMGGQISWLLPAALLLVVVLLVSMARLPRTDGRRAAVVLWGGWLLVTGATFSLMKGIIHEYYTVALAPAIAALVGIGAAALWQRRALLFARISAAALVAVTAWWSDVLLGRSPTWHPELRTAITVAGVIGALALLVPPRRLPRLAAVPLVAAVVVSALGGSVAYAAQTVATPHTGSIVTAGPAVAGGRGGPGGGPRRAPAGIPAGIPAGAPGGFRGTQGGPGGFAGGQPPTAGLGGGGGLGGLLDAGTPSAALVTLLSANAAHYDWPAAAVGSNEAAGVQLASGLPVMAIGGFNGSDNSPTLAQFQQYVASGRVHYFLANGSGGRGFGTANGGSSASSDITTWVAAHFTATTVGGVTVYDLTAPVS